MFEVKVKVPVEFNFEVKGTSEKEAMKEVLQDVRRAIYQDISWLAGNQVEEWIENAEISMTLVEEE